MTIDIPTIESIDSTIMKALIECFKVLLSGAHPPVDSICYHLKNLKKVMTLIVPLRSSLVIHIPELQYKSILPTVGTMSASESIRDVFTCSVVTVVDNSCKMGFLSGCFM